jgi:hypothetical protein
MTASLPPNAGSVTPFGTSGMAGRTRGPRVLGHSRYVVAGP